MAEDIWDELLSLCDDADLDAWETATYWGSVRPKLKEGLEKLKVEHDLLREHSGRWLHFVAVDYPEIKESLSPQKLMELKKKAEKWDRYLESIKDSVPHVSLADYEILEDKLEAIKKFVEEGPYPVENTLKAWQQAVDDWLGKLMNILEVEG